MQRSQATGRYPQGARKSSNYIDVQVVNVNVSVTVSGVDVGADVCVVVGVCVSVSVGGSVGITANGLTIVPPHRKQG